jgi:hypothetical protein
MSTVTNLPERILQRNAEVHLLRDILNSFDPTLFEKAKSKYRKPSYQRELGKSLSWNKSLIHSILQGKAIGGIVMSKWIKQSTGEDGEPTVDIYYNIEDGGTRLGACKKFNDDEFKTDYGDIKHPDIKDRFLNYPVAVEILEKVSTKRGSDRIYFGELCENFSLLQEGTALTASDRYAANVADPEFNFDGSPTVNFTIAQINSYPHFKSYFGLSDVGPRGANRKKLATSVALVSGMMFGPQFANSQYFLHVPILRKELNEYNKTKFTIVKQLIVQTIKNIELTLPKWKNERFTGYFANCAKFTGLMIADIHNQYPDEIVQNDDFKTFATEFNTRWTLIVNRWRGQVQLGGSKGADEWLETEVYPGLDKANKRNCLEANLKKRMFAVRNWTLENM